MKNLIPLIVIFAILILLDLYVFKSLKVVTSAWQKSSNRNLAYISFWITTIISYSLLIFMLTSFGRDASKSGNYFSFFMAFGFVILLTMPKLVIIIFHGIDDITFAFKKLYGFLFASRDTSIPNSGNKIERWAFISKMGWALAAIPFFSIVYGMAKGRFNFKIEEASLSFPNLPKSLSGLRIIHISDLHIGSFFNNYEAVNYGIEKINALNPDIIMFTGDMVNNVASELDGWIPHLSKLKAKHGKYSIFGNHDYGDYVHFSSSAEKAANLEQLKQHHKDMGFQLLLNEKVSFSLDGSDDFEIIGIENWGQGGFSQYGDLTKAMNGSDDKKFQLLLSHDPSHWDAEVLGKTNIDLTLAGHTHGMQFGVKIPGWMKWSPAQYRYPRWGGLYTEKKQHLYVNRGFGYIGFPGRIGMPPEITLLELNRA